MNAIKSVQLMELGYDAEQIETILALTESEIAEHCYEFWYELTNDEELAELKTNQTLEIMF